LSIVPVLVTKRAMPPGRSRAIEARLARDHAATRCPLFTDGRPIDWQVLELPPGQPRRDDEAE
jgi:hypothetical protein